MERQRQTEKQKEKRQRERGPKSSLDLYFMIIEGVMAGMERNKEKEKQGSCASF